MSLGVLEIALPRVQPNLVEVSVDNLTAKLLEEVKQLQERFLRELVQQAVK